MAQVEVRVGQFHIGVRTNDLAVDARLRAVLGSRIVADPAVRASYAIHRSPGPEGGGEATFTIYYDCNHIFTTRSLDRALGVVITHLEHHLPRSEHPSHVLEIDVAAIVSADGRAVLVPWVLPYKAPATELRLRRHGLWLYEAPTVWVDTRVGDLVIQQHRLAAPSPADWLAEGAMTPPGRRTLQGWLFLGSAERAQSGLSRAEALAWALGHTYRHHTLTTNLRALAGLLRDLEVVIVEEVSIAPVRARQLLHG